MEADTPASAEVLMQEVFVSAWQRSWIPPAITVCTEAIGRRLGGGSAEAREQLSRESRCCTVMPIVQNI